MECVYEWLGFFCIHVPNYSTGRETYREKNRQGVEGEFCLFKLLTRPVLNRFRDCGICLILILGLRKIWDA
jgi:hypothetical protein